jgi:S-DNA-T family DNA segregation ATPase FtsK/SpoIIIE
VDALPERITSAQARMLPADVPPAAWAALCVGGDSLRRLGADATVEGPAVYVAGERHGGRSTALLSVAFDALDRGAEVVAVAPGRNSALRHLSGLAGVAAVLGVRQPTERQVQLAMAAAAGPGARVVLVDDAEQLQNTDGGRALARMMLDEDDRQILVVAADVTALAAPAPGSLLAEIGRGCTGLLLTPRSARVHLFGTLTRLPEAYLSGEPPGRAVLLRRGGATPVQVPFADEGDAVARPRRAGSVPALLQVVDALAGPGPATLEVLRELVGALRAAGFDELDREAVDRAAGLAAGWTGAPGDLISAVRVS